jgi:hypothetical protein
MKSRLFFSLLAAILVLLAQPARAQDYSNIRIVRLSFVEGAVQYQRPGQDWQDAHLNLPIQEGFALRTTDGFAEVEFEDALTMRMATNATVEFTGLALQNGGRVTRLTVPEGTAIITAKLKREDSVSVASPNLNLNLTRNGHFRVDVSPEGSWVTVFHGKVEVNSPAGATTILGGGHTLHLDANGSGSSEVSGNPHQDDFDKWVLHREEALNSAASETSSVLGNNSYSTGYADLYNYGLWSDIPGYGAGWVPYGVGVGWMPFTYGQWQFMGTTGWNWMSSEPWGWVPYHFGSWVHAPGIGWAWLPVGATSWVPSTASWVNVNNQLAWIPNGPPITSKASKTQLAAIPTTAILASQGDSGAIKAGSSLPVTREGLILHATPASAPTFAGVPNQSTQATATARSSANIKSFAQSQSAPPSVSRGLGAPASLRGPSAATTAMHSAGVSSAPHAVMAPHSPPAPAAVRGGSMEGFRGGFGARGGMVNGSHTTNGVATSPAPTSQGSAAGSASHSTASMGSTGGAHK